MVAMDAGVRLLIACDFDGTVAGIQSSPDFVELHSAARALFEEANRQTDISLAFVSGRDLEDLRERTEDIRAWRCGSHGRDISDPDGLLVVTTEPLSITPDEVWLSAARDAGLRLEKKRHGLALHWREAPHVKLEHPLVAALAAWATTNGLAIVHGRKVLEVTTPGPAKVDAISLIAEVSGARRVVYAGDDLTDFPALEWAARHGRALFVESPERREPLPPGVEKVGSIDELVDLLWLELGPPAGSRQ